MRYQILRGSLVVLPPHDFFPYRVNKAAWVLFVLVKKKKVLEKTKKSLNYFFRRPIPAINLLPFSLFSRYAVHFYTNTQYSKGAGRGPRGRLAGETYIVNYKFFVFSGFGERLGWVGFNYMHRYYSRLLTTIYQYSSFDFTTYIKSTGGPEYFLRLTTTASSLGILTTTVSRTIRYKSMTSADGGSYAVQYPCDGWVDYYTWKSGTHTIDGLNTQAGSIFYRQQVESANAEQYAYQNISTSASDATTLVASAPPPFFFGQKRLRTLPHYKREIVYGYEGSTYLVKKTPFKRPGSVFIVGFRQLRFKFWGRIFC